MSTSAKADFKQEHMLQTEVGGRTMIQKIMVLETMILKTTIMKTMILKKKVLEPIILTRPNWAR